LKTCGSCFVWPNVNHSFRDWKGGGGMMRSRRMDSRGGSRKR
jgi:hypothetical protein